MSESVWEESVGGGSRTVLLGTIAAEHAPDEATVGLHVPGELFVPRALVGAGVLVMDRNVAVPASIPRRMEARIRAELECADESTERQFHFHRVNGSGCSTL